MKVNTLLYLYFTLILVLLVVQPSITIKKFNQKNAENDNDSHTSTSEDLYSKQGKNWVGLCKSGLLQSPVNIVESVNSKLSLSSTTFEYKMPTGQANGFYYDGDKLYLEGDFGQMTFYNEEGAIEKYKASRIEIHTPSEHIITKHGKSPHYAVEIQIYHDFVISDFPNITNKEMQVRQSVVSILLSEEDDVNDIFLESLGINGKASILFNKI